MRLSSFASTTLLVTALLALSACAAKKHVYVEQPVDALYNTAMNDIDNGNYKDAVSAFQAVERQHPYSVWATKAQLMEAYAQYERNKYDEAISALDRFIQLHPGNRDTPYAYYLKGLCYYEQISDVGRDQQMTRDALHTFQEVVDRFPDSKYATDAHLKVQLARDHLAGKDMAIGRYYEKQGDYLAALNRFKRVVTRYQTTTHVPEALERMVEVYVALGLVNDARRTAAVLGYNYPGSIWYQYAYRLLRTGQPGTATFDPDAAIDWIPGVGPSHSAPTAPSTVALPKPKPAKDADDSGWFGWLW